LIFVFIFIFFPIFSCSCFTQTLSVTVSVYAWHWVFLSPLENVSLHFSAFCVPLKFIVVYIPISDIIIIINVGVKFHVLQIEALKAAGVDEVVLAINYQPEVGTYAPASCSRTKSQKESWNLPVSCSYDNPSLVPICNMQVLVLSVVGGRAGDDEFSG